MITNYFLMFKPTKLEFESFCEKLLETKKDMTLEIMMVAYSEIKDHPYIMLTKEAQKMYRKFDEKKAFAEKLSSFI